MIASPTPSRLARRRATPTAKSFARLLSRSPGTLESYGSGQLDQTTRLHMSFSNFFGNIFSKGNQSPKMPPGTLDALAAA